MGAYSRRKWDKRAKAHQEILQKHGPESAEKYRQQFHKTDKLDAALIRASK